jgi:hypothetical protein
MGSVRALLSIFGTLVPDDSGVPLRDFVQHPATIIASDEMIRGRFIISLSMNLLIGRIHMCSKVKMQVSRRQLYFLLYSEHTR